MFHAVTFDVFAEAEPGLLPRVLVPFARRDLAPETMKARRFGNRYQVTITVESVSEQEIRLVEGNLRQIVGMHRVEVTLRSSIRAVA